MSRKYRIYCITEGQNKYITQSVAPTVCPTDIAHTINPSSICEFDTNAEGTHMFGDGADGDVVISTNTALSRDMYYRTLTLTGGIVLNPAGWRIFITDTLSINDCSISLNGVPGTSAPSASNAANTLGYGSAGGAGGTEGANGKNGTALTSGTLMGGSGGAGGAGQGGSGGIAGSSSAPPDVVGGTNWFRCAEFALTGRGPTYIQMNGGTGGGGGAGGAIGGNGGGGGGVIMIAARHIVWTTGSITAGGGGGGTPNSVNAGGGGGGGGGCVVIITTDDISGLTVSANGGAGGIVTGGVGLNGIAGSAGAVFKLSI